MIIVKNTPIEEYTIQGKTVYVKREDLSTGDPAPRLAKLRGVYKRLEEIKKQGFTKVGVYDTRVSKAGWGVAAIAKEMGGMEVTNFYPHLKDYTDIPHNQKKVLELGGKLHPMKGGRTAVLYSQAKKIMAEKGIYPMPLGLVVEESVNSTAEEARNVAEKYLGGDLVVCIGSGMITAGLYTGIGDKVKINAISAGMNTKKQSKRIEQVTGIKNIEQKINLVLPHGVDYYSEEEIVTPFECSKWYDAKAWKWMVDNIEKLKEPILFWLIGT